MQARTSFGSITVDSSLVTIERRSLPGLSGDVRSVALSALTGVDMRNATMWEPGHLRLVYPGASPGIAGKMRLYDPDTIMFNAEHQEPMLDVYDALMTIISGQPHKSARPRSPSSSPASRAAIIVGILLVAATVWLCLLARV